MTSQHQSHTRTAGAINQADSHDASRSLNASPELLPSNMYHRTRMKNCIFMDLADNIRPQRLASASRHNQQQTDQAAFVGL